MTLGPLPVDDEALSHYKHALGASFALDEEGNHIVVGAEFTINDLLDFYSGFDPETDTMFEGFVGGMEMTSATKPVYSEKDLICALIGEIERLRSEKNEGSLDS
jgi:hypothetical protein